MRKPAKRGHPWPFSDCSAINRTISKRLRGFGYLRLPHVKRSGSADSCRCREDLSDHQVSHRGVAEVAIRWGFRSAAHFTRVFHARYGAWSGRETFGGDFTSGPTAVSPAPNRIDLIAPGTDGDIYDRTWDGTSWQPPLWDQVGAVKIRLPNRYRFSVDLVHVTTTRSLDADTDAAQASVGAGNWPTQTKDAVDRGYRRDNQSQGVANQSAELRAGDRRALRGYGIQLPRAQQRARRSKGYRRRAGEGRREPHLRQRHLDLEGPRRWHRRDPRRGDRRDDLGSGDRQPAGVTGRLVARPARRHRLRQLRRSGRCRAAGLDRAGPASEDGERAVDHHDDPPRHRLLNWMRGQLAIRGHLDDQQGLRPCTPTPLAATFAVTGSRAAGSGRPTACAAGRRPATRRPAPSGPRPGHRPDTAPRGSPPRHPGAGRAG